MNFVNNALAELTSATPMSYILAFILFGAIVGAYCLTQKTANNGR
jgi:hypothetical protein